MESLRTLIIGENLSYPSLKPEIFGPDRTSMLMNWGAVGMFGFCSNDRHLAKVPRPDIVYWRSSIDPAFPLPQVTDHKLSHIDLSGEAGSYTSAESTREQY
jgi:hypothetical protein